MPSILCQMTCLSLHLASRRTAAQLPHACQQTGELVHTAWVVPNPPPPTCTQHILVHFQMHMATMNTMGWANAIQDIRSNMTQVPVCACVTAADSSAWCVRAKLTLMKGSRPILCVGEMNCLTKVPKVELMPVRTTIASTSSLGSSAFHTCQPRDCV